MVFAFSKMERVIVLNVQTINFFCLDHLVEVTAFRMLSVCFALVMVVFKCCENVSFGSRVFQEFWGVLLLVVFDCYRDSITL